MSIYKHIDWLGLPEEMEFSKKKFKGRLAGTSWNYAQNIDGVNRTRAIIFALPLLFILPVGLSFIAKQPFASEILIERIIMSIILILSGIYFHKNRILFIIVASLPVAAVFLTYIFAPTFSIRALGFYGAILMLLYFGIANHLNAKKQRKYLESKLISAHLIDDVN